MNTQLAQALIPVGMAMVEAARVATSAVVRDSTTTCRPGCSSCCKRHVSISFAEAVVLVDSLKKSKKWDRVQAAAKEQHSLALVTNRVAWYKMGMACPILNENGMCDAYQTRPVVCSAHFAKSPPEACSPTSTSLRQFVPFDVKESHALFHDRFKSILGASSTLRTQAPIPVALLLGDKISMNYGPDFDDFVASISREFGI